MGRLTQLLIDTRYQAWKIDSTFQKSNVYKTKT